MNCILYKAALLCCLSSIAVAQAPSAPPGNEGKEDPGKALLERTCTKCHNLAGTLSQHNSPARWSAIVDDMVARGAEASDAEIDKIIVYLSKIYGPTVSINKVNAEELATALDLPPAGAAAIVEYREKNGSFKSLEDLKKVPSIDWKIIESKKDRLDFAGDR
jgi:competence protein ComEA